MNYYKTEGAYPLSDNDNCTVLHMGNHVEVRTMTANPKGLQSITKLSKEQYIINETGEVMDYKQSDNRADNTSSLKRTFTKMRHLINNNFTGALNELFITTTYADNMTDTRQLMRDGDIFIKRMKRRYPGMEYIAVVEPQARGAWHIHWLIKVPSVSKLYIPNDLIFKLWGKLGWTTTKRLNYCDNIGAYLTAYLADIDIDSCTDPASIDPTLIKTVETTDENGKPISKRVIKGGRCHLYPVGMNIVRHSRGIKAPEPEKMKGSDVKKIVGSRTPDYSKTVEILDDDNKSLNTIRYFNFNLKRTKCQGEIFNDDTTSDRRVHDGTADTGEHIKDNPVLQAIFDTFHRLQQLEQSVTGHHNTRAPKLLQTPC